MIPLLDTPFFISGGAEEFGFVDEKEVIDIYVILHTR